MAKAKEELWEGLRQEYDDWLESIVIVDKDGIPLTPELVEDKDWGEDGGEE